MSLRVLSLVALPALCATAAMSLFSGCSSDPAAPASDALGDGGACPAPTGVPISHEGDLLGDETWSADAVHLVSKDVYVRDGRKLTIEPCAIVRLAPGASMEIAHPLVPNAGALVAEGTKERPIRFERSGESAWGGIFVHAPGTARLSHVSLLGGGQGRPALSLRGQGAEGGDGGLFVDSVRVDGAEGVGVKLEAGAAFAVGSRELTVTGAGGYPLEVGESAIDGVPQGAYSGNAKDEILIAVETVGGNGGIQRDTRIRNWGVPWHVGSVPENDDLSVGTTSSPVTLTIDAGVTLRFERGNALWVHAGEGNSASVVALGTDSSPVVFTSAEASPQPGDWRGLVFQGRASAENRLEFVRIEYSGASCHCSLVTCNANVSTYEGAILLERAPSTVFLRNATISDGAGHGVVQGYDGADFDWTESNSFVRLGGCKVTRPRNADTSCPDPMPRCD